MTPPPTSRLACEIEGCSNDAAWQVLREYETRRVCTPCRDELISLHGWSFGGQLARRMRVKEGLL